MAKSNRRHRWLCTLCAGMVVVLGVASVQAEPLDTGVAIRGAAFNAEGQLLALWHDYGLHFTDGDEAYFACKDSMPQVTDILRTNDRRVLISGAEGAHLSISSGCKWQQTGGLFSFDVVVGLFRDPTDAKRVLLAYGGLGLIIESRDGGHTTDTTPVLSVSNVDMTRMVSNGSRILITGRDRLDQGRLLWWSTDGGLSFQSMPLGAGSDLVPWTLTDTTAWLTRGATLVEIDLSANELVDGPGLPAKPQAVTLDPEGRLWLALGSAGLWSLGPKTDAKLQLEREQASTWVGAFHGALWVGSFLTEWSQPALVQRAFGSEEWQAALVLSSQLDVSPTCTSLNTQICETTSREWQDSFDAESRSDEVLPEEPLSKGGGCAFSQSSDVGWIVLILAFSALLTCRRRAKSEF